MNRELPRQAQLRQRLQVLTAAQLRALARRLGIAAGQADEPAERLYAWLVAADAATGIDPELLRRQLAQQLPAYMLPAQFCIREALPRNRHGKVDRDALQADPAAAALPVQHDSSTPGEAPDAVSETVLGVWREVLGSTRITAGDDFFELGGDSLLAMRVVSRLQRHFDTALRPTDLFEHRTVRALAVRLRQLGAGRADDVAAAGPPREQVEI